MTAPSAPAAPDLLAAVDRLLRYEPDVIFRRRARTVVEYLEPRPGDRILESGCGLGFLLYLLSRIERCQLFGVELDRERLATAVHERPLTGAELYLGDVTRLPFREASFDKAILSEVIEHVPDDAAAVREAARVLRPGGVLAVTVPHTGYPFLVDPLNYVRERAGLGHFSREPWAGVWTDHLRLYTPESLREVVEQAGLRITHAKMETRYTMPFGHFLIYGAGKFLVRKRLVRSNGNPAGRTSLWSTDDRLTPLRVLIRAFTLVDRLNKPSYETGPALNLCVRAVKPA